MLARADLGIQLESIIPAEILVHWEKRLIDARLQMACAH